MGSDDWRWISGVPSTVVVGVGPVVDDEVGGRRKSEGRERIKESEF